MAKYLDMTGLTYLISKIIALINAKSDKNHTHNYLSGLSVSGKTITYTKGDGTSGTITTQDTNTTYTPATTTANGLMSSTDKAKLDAITESADAVSITQKLTSGTEIGTVKINGTDTKLYAPTNTDTHYASKNVVGSSTATSNTTTALTNGNVYLNSVENGAVTSAHKISGTGATTVTTDTSGNIIINSTDTNTTYTHPTTSGNKHIPSGGSSGQVLKWCEDGTATWGTDNNTTYSAGTGISLSGTTFSNSGVRSIASGSANGTISVNTNGTSTDVAVKGLGSAAYTASTAYATSGHTHNYAGSSSAGGAATTALTCTGNSATATNSDMVDGYHSYELQTLAADGNLHDKNNRAFVQWDGSSYFWLRTPSNSTAVNHSATSDTSSTTHGLSSTGFGAMNLTYCQTENEFFDNSGWCHYIIANHGDGANYYNYTIGLPFYSPPIYQRQTGSATSRSGWHKFYTTENITYGTSALTPGSSSLTTGNIYLQYE